MTALILVLLAAADVETAHYLVHADGVDAEDTGRMLEAHYARLEKFFGKAPAVEGKLQLAVYPTREAWLAALKADGIAPPGGGGYYHPENRKAYLWIQPSDYSTCHLILHEATHQFHFLACTGNKTPSTYWYCEGVAEYFAMHNWDGKTLDTGVVPAVTLEDGPQRALDALDRKDYDLTAVLFGRRPGDRPEGWALVHYLLNTQPKKFRALADKLDAGTDAEKAWKEVFGTMQDGFARELRAWVEKHAQPWKIVWISWQERGAALEGKSATNAIMTLKEPASFAVEIDPVEGATKAGVVFGLKSPKEFQLLQVLSDHSWRIMKFNDGTWTPVKSGKLLSVQRHTIQLVHKKGSVSLSADGKPVGTFKVEGDVGLNVEAGRAMFRFTKR